MSRVKHNFRENGGPVQNHNIISGNMAALVAVITYLLVFRCDNFEKFFIFY